MASFASTSTSGRVALAAGPRTVQKAAAAARPMAALSARAHVAKAAALAKASPKASLSASTRRAGLSVRAEETVTVFKKYEVVLDKPLQVKFARGNDGGAYVVQVAPGASAEYKKFTPGDKIVRVSASFGEEVWAAENYGQVMYAVKTRNGNVFFELEERGGDMSCFEFKKKKDAAFMGERNSGNYGAGTQALQMERYVAKKELNDQREAMFNEALGLFKGKKYDEALVLFENVVGLEPPGYIGDNNAKVTDIYRVATYNVACCYSMIKQEDAGMDALKATLLGGFDNYKMVRSDPNLAFLRGSEDFDAVINKFDEPLINENAMKALKGLFGRGKKDDDEDY